MSEPMTKVIIDTPGPSITIEAIGSLEDVTDRALYLFNKVGGWPDVNNKVGFSSNVASQLERNLYQEYE